MIQEFQQSDDFFLRQASEQYFTSSHVLAQLLRHVMVSPHTTHGFDGKYDLLPLKPADELVTFLGMVGFSVANAG